MKTNVPEDTLTKEILLINQAPVVMGQQCSAKTVSMCFIDFLRKIVKKINFGDKYTPSLRIAFKNLDQTSYSDRINWP